MTIPVMDGTTGQTPSPVNVLYIAGAGRSGSTLLARMLGEIDGYVPVGELRYFWSRGMLERRLCGCGAPIPDCWFWSPIVERFSRLGETRVHETIDRIDAMMGPRASLGALISRLRGRRLRLHDNATLDRIGSLYAAVQRATGARCIVDSSKPPTYGLLLDAVPGIDLRVVHLVRDPRATAFSWLRYKPARDRPSGGHMPRQPPWRSAIAWDMWNLEVERLWSTDSDRYIRIRYEDLVTRPAATLRRVTTLGGFADQTAFPETSGNICLAPSHTVAGNPSRLDHGDTEIHLDADWATRLRATDRTQVSVLCAPLLHRYGYKIRVRAGRSEVRRSVYRRAPDSHFGIGHPHHAETLGGRGARPDTGA